MQRRALASAGAIQRGHRPWLSDYFRCDWSYLSHFYKTGLKGEFRSYWCDDTRLITALTIPEFRPAAWKKRWAGIVV